MNDAPARSAGSDHDGDRLWELFHENSKIGRHEAAANRLRVPHPGPGEQPPARLFRQYPGIDLPEVLELSPRPVVRDAATGPLNIGHLAALLARTGDLLAPTDGPHAGEPTGPFRLFVHAIHLEGLDAGLYYHDAGSRRLRLLNPGGHSKTIGAAMPEKGVVHNSEVLLFVTATMTLADLPQGNRDYRLLLFDAGRLEQNVRGQAHRLGLACARVDYFYDREIDAWLGLDGISQSTLLILGVGLGLDPGPTSNGPLRS